MSFNWQKYNHSTYEEKQRMIEDAKEQLKIDAINFKERINRIKKL